MKRWLNEVKIANGTNLEVMIRLSSGSVSHPELPSVTYVTDTPGWFISLLPSTVSQQPSFFTCPSLFPSPVLYRWLTAVSTHCLWGEVTATQVSGISAPICHRWSSPVPHTLCPGNIRRGLAAPPAALMAAVCTLTVTELPRDWICVKSSSRF